MTSVNGTTITMTKGDTLRLTVGIKQANGQTYTKEITLESDVDVTAIGMYYRGQTSDGFGVLEFELNVYKNGVRLTRN